MKKLIIASIVVLTLSGCAVGTYMPNALNNYGTQTQVVLSEANFRIVRDVEVVIEVNNTNLKRQDVERSAYGELLRQYKLTGSQAFINVSIEEVRRDDWGFFRALIGIPKRKQYVAARATIIEFLQPNGEPIKSVESPYTKSVETTLVTKQTAAPEDNTKETESQQQTIKQKQINYYYIAYQCKMGKIDIEKLDDIYDRNRIKDLMSNNTANKLLNKAKDFNASMN